MFLKLTWNDKRAKYVEADIPCPYSYPHRNSLTTIIRPAPRHCEACKAQRSNPPHPSHPPIRNPFTPPLLDLPFVNPTSLRGVQSTTKQSTSPPSSSQQQNHITPERTNPHRNTKQKRSGEVSQRQSGCYPKQPLLSHRRRSLSGYRDREHRYTKQHYRNRAVCLCQLQQAYPRCNKRRYPHWGTCFPALPKAVAVNPAKNSFLHRAARL